MRTAEPRPRAHNMSAPPRATISFRALAPEGSAAGEGAGAGLCWVCRIDVAGFFWPLPEATARDPAQRALWVQTLEPERCLLAQALAEEGGRGEADAELRRQVDGMPAEAVLDALRDVALRTDSRALGLPAFGLLRTARRVLPAAHRQAATAMRLAVAVLARRRGGVFLRAADPLPPANVTEPLDLWAAVAREQRDGDDGRGLITPERDHVAPAQAGAQVTAPTWVQALDRVRGRLCAGTTAAAAVPCPIRARRAP